jgi:DNA-binding NarL/FixJ family response regulator
LKPRILICEDIDALREDYCDLLKEAGVFDILAAVPSAEAALEYFHASSIDLLLTDIGLPKMDGIALIKTAQTLQPSCICIVLSVFGDDSLLISALKAGASGYVLKDDPVALLVDRLQRALCGDLPISRQLTASLVRYVQDDNSQKDMASAPCAGPVVLETCNAVACYENRWSMREQEILNLADRGLAVAEIARVLNISSNTVKTHIKNLYRKLGVRSRAEAIYEARLMGLLDTDLDSRRMAHSAVFGIAEQQDALSDF